MQATSVRGWEGLFPREGPSLAGVSSQRTKCNAASLRDVAKATRPTCLKSCRSALVRKGTCLDGTAASHVIPAAQHVKSLIGIPRIAASTRWPLRRKGRFSRPSATRRHFDPFRADTLVVAQTPRAKSFAWASRYVIQGVLTSMLTRQLSAAVEEDMSCNRMLPRSTAHDIVDKNGKRC